MGTQQRHEASSGLTLAKGKHFFGSAGRFVPAERKLMKVFVSAYWEAADANHLKESPNPVGIWQGRDLLPDPIYYINTI